MKIKNVLLIEDSEIDIVVIKETLLRQKNHFEIKVIRNDSDADLYNPLSIIDGLREKPDLVIVNEELIYVDQIHSLLKTLYYYMDFVPIVLFTASKCKVMSDLDEKVSEVVVKPLEINEFVRSIQRISYSWLTTSNRHKLIDKN
ncbi:response regulator [Arenibacter algicola]|uniref:hypothetical protein n=1 Tax=Arenibacter algicola TaxID=616991 RepID=UPI0004DF6179|nr:hypothetical protein [Arenibacter algicola]